MTRSRTDEPNHRGEYRAPYEPPAMTVLGSVNQMTAGNATSGPDSSALGSGAISDRALKEDVSPVDVNAVCAAALEVPVSNWRYRADDASVRHIGPMAQDFAAAFGVGSDDRRIETVDAFGVALASIQALHSQLRERDAQIDALWTELHALRARLDDREAVLAGASLNPTGAVR